MSFRIVAFIFVFLLSLVHPVLAHQPLRITFLSPAKVGTHPFWGQYVGFMKTAALSLGAELEVLEAEDRYGVCDNARAVLSRKVHPDYLIYVYQAEASPVILEQCEAVGVKSVIVNTDVVPEERDRIGRPGEKFRQWVCHFIPDDRSGGKLLAKALARQAEDLGLPSVGGECRFIGLGGTRDTTASRYRQEGLEDFLSEGGYLDRFVYTNWHAEVAREKARLLLKLYPKTRVYWTVSDALGLGVVESMRQAGLRPGRDAIVGGVDWTVEGIEAVRRGELAASVGGHFMEGAWALIYLYDLHAGGIARPEEKNCFSRMALIERATVDRYAPLLDPANWEKIDFKRLTHTHNPALKQYDFSPDVMLRALDRQ